MDGKKTKIGIVLFAVYNIAIAMKPELASVLNSDIVNTILISWTGYGFRDAVRKAES